MMYTLIKTALFIEIELLVDLTNLFSVYWREDNSSLCEKIVFSLHSDAVGSVRNNCLVDLFCTAWFAVLF